MPQAHSNQNRPMEQTKKSVIEGGLLVHNSVTCNTCGQCTSLTTRICVRLSLLAVSALSPSLLPYHPTTPAPGHKAHALGGCTELVRYDDPDHRGSLFPQHVQRRVRITQTKVPCLMTALASQEEQVAFLVSRFHSFGALFPRLSLPALFVQCTALDPVQALRFTIQDLHTHTHTHTHIHTHTHTPHTHIYTHRLRQEGMTGQGAHEQFNRLRSIQLLHSY